MQSSATTPCSTSARLWTLGAVSFLNSRPLIDRLADHASIRLSPAVPAALFHLLESRQVDVAMLPVVDLHRSAGRFRRISDCCIASEAETLTVRVFSRMPPDRVTRLHADTDSHTSVILAQVIWRELYHRKLEVVPWTNDVPRDDIDALLLIGDKVVTDAPRGYGFETDLGGAWRHLTGHPFVFAVWAAHADFDSAELAITLERARDEGLAATAELAERYAPDHGWPVSLARRYLGETLRYQLTPKMLIAMDAFELRARHHGLL